MISLVNETISKQDVDALIEWLKTYPRLTKGEQTKKFEEEWSDWLGCKYSVFVNSGSSAILLMTYALIQSNMMKNNKIIIPALSWSTDLAPAIQFGLDPILCDCNLDDLSVDLNHLESLFEMYKPSALLLVSVMGLSPNMHVIQELCSKYGVILLEDCCEATGSMFDDKKLGTFGLMSSFSYYFGHHMSTIEGGMVCTNSKDLYNILLSLRSHGWSRDCSQEYAEEWKEKNYVDDFEEMFTFYYPGFNLRSTDIQAFLGRNQLKNLDKTIDQRIENYFLYRRELDDTIWKPNHQLNSVTSSFNYPIITHWRDKLVEKLQVKRIEIRPLICGSLEYQPFVKNHKKIIPSSTCTSARDVKNFGMFLPNNPDITKDQIKYICKIINEVICSPTTQ